MITVTILTKDSAKKIGAALESVSWAPEVILLDTGSTDETLEIAATFPNVQIHRSPFTGFGELKNRAAQLASHDWILNLDSDEALSRELRITLQDLILDPASSYRFPRKNFFNGKHIRGCGWSPDRVVRLYHRGHANFSSARVHESVQSTLIIDISEPIHHTSYTSIEDFLTKMQRYSTLWAEQQTRKGSLPRALFHKWAAFIKSYFLKCGFRDGYEGYLISTYNAHTAFYKYLKLRHLQRS